ncbi:dTDP-glucose 4,6-dehydratase [Pseudoalteromonas sp. G4]|uniref:dTDP-glucose 4,6-dehydratase n=1 Tax=Pseudoalteromonas sp. G4 TaxID=2992761 RepID=UPI00237DD84E|nr:dTDP-glucose 4,6-dehydratase [Pseudoalteromonas sp. G4]MDE3271241.1 dTDP-glucose 4,6-dehydratase [Pseudoalteromonas sp. G4]
MSKLIIKNILVTGGAGFIGSNFVDYWLKNNQGNVIVLDLLTYAGNLSSLSKFKSNERFSFYQGDIADKELVGELLAKHEINCIVNFAAESHVDRSISGATPFIFTNIVGTFELLECAKQFWLTHPNFKENHRFHHISTDEVYGSLTSDDAPFKESNQYQPNSPYSASKASSDHLVRAYHHTYGLNVTTSNCSNNYGPLHFPEKLIPLAILNILHDKPIPVYGNGQQIRDWLFVDDHCLGIDLILQKGIVGETYNIGGNNELKNIDLIHRLCELMNYKFANNASLEAQYPNALSAINGQSEKLITFVQDRPGHDVRYAIDASKAMDELGYCPNYNFSNALETTVNWYLNNNNWWLPLYHQ